MARTLTNAVTSKRSGTALAAEQDGDPVNGHYYLNSGATLLLVRNADAASRVVTIQLAATLDGQAATARAITVAAGETQVLGPYSVVNYGSQVNVDVAHANLKLRVIEPGTT